MPHSLFFFGKGKLRIWYFLFYLVGLPLYILGIVLFSNLKPGIGPQGGEFVLSVLAIGYLLLGFFSLINTIIYIHKTRKYLKATSAFFGFQIVFWWIGYILGNNYTLLLLFFIFSLCLAIYLNLQALASLYTPPHLSHQTK